MQRINHDTLAAIGVMILSIIALWETRGLSEMSYIFPRTVGVLLFVLSIIYLLSSVWKGKPGNLLEGIQKRTVLVFVIGVVGYAILIPTIGFLWASIVFMGVISWYLQKEQHQKNLAKKLLHSGLSAILFSTGFYLLFHYVFMVPLP